MEEFSQKDNLPEDIQQFLSKLDLEYAEVFMTMWRSPCAACNNGEERLVHRSPACFELGEALKSLKTRYNL